MVLHQVAERTVAGWLDRLQASGPSDYLSDDEIRRQAARGAIKPHAERPDALRIDAEAEVRRALEGFRQRRYRILLDGQMLNDLDHSLDLPAQARLTFLRLVPWWAAKPTNGLPMQHYQADTRQQARIDLLEAFLDRQLDALPERDALLAEDGYQHPFWDEVDGLALADAFLAEAGPEGQQALVDALVFPRSLRHDETDHAYIRQRLLQIVSQAGVEAYPSPYGFQALERRVRHMLVHAFEDSDHALQPGYKADNHWGYPSGAWATPGLAECLALLAGHPVDEAWLDLAQWLLGGEWDRPNPASNAYYPRLAEVYQGKATEAIRRFAVGLAEAGRLEATLHERAVRTWAESLCTLPPLVQGDSTGEQRLDALNAEFVDHALTQLPDSATLLRSLIDEPGTSTAHWLLAGVRAPRPGAGGPRKALRNHQGRALTALLDIGHLERTKRPHWPNSSPASPRQPAHRPALQRRGQRSGAGRPRLGRPEAPAAPVPRPGAGHRPQRATGGRPAKQRRPGAGRGGPRRPASRPGPGRRRAPGRLPRRAGRHPWAFPNTRLLLDAFRGLERKALEKLQRHAQAALRAYGLLPTRGADETRERYLALKRYHREVERYGAERQANSQAAIQAGLENLARTAGYGDATRLEWAMEAEIAEQTPDRLHLDGYDLWLELQGSTRSWSPARAASA